MDKGFPPDAAARIKDFASQLAPTDVLARVRLYVVDIPYGTMFSKEIEAAKAGDDELSRLARDLVGDSAALSRALPILSEGKVRRGIEFGRQIAQHAAHPHELLREVLEMLKDVPEPKQSPSFLGGLLRELEQCNARFVQEILDEVAVEPSLRRFLPFLTCQTDIDGRDLDRLMKALDAGAFGAEALEVLGRGRVLEPVAPAEVSAFVLALPTRPSGYAIAVEILAMVATAPGRKVQSEFLPTIQQLLCHEQLRAALHGRLATMQSYHLGELCEAALAHSEDPAAFVQEFMGRLRDAILDSRSDHSTIRELTKVLFNRQPETAWSVLSDFLLSASDTEKAMLIFGLRGIGGGGEDAKVANQLPQPMLEAWCRDQGEQAARVLAEMCTMATEDQSGEWHWTSIAQFLLQEYGSDEGVRKTIGASFMTFMRWGSLIPYYRGWQGLYRQYAADPRIEVASWAQEQVAYLDMTIRREQEREGESELGLH